jgi:Fic family protein
MTYKDKISQIDQLMQSIGELGKLDKTILKKINYKFRLDWNYYSNRMEGGTLTKQETRSVMVGNITVQGKPILDVMEMQGHDEVVRDILSISKGEIRISEKRIKQVHKAIIKETEDEDNNRQIGKWKEKPNEIINYKDEKINFTPPADVADEIHNLLNQTNAQLDAFFHPKKESQHPLIIASDFHLGYVSIHPFFDGNGRSARIFTNLILIACGYPPIIIDDVSKNAYYQILGDIQAYGGNQDVLYEFMAGLLLKSVELVNDAIEGKDIEDDDDLDKRLKLIENQLIADKDTKVEITKDKVEIGKFLNSNILPLFKAIEIKHKKLSPLFANNEIYFRYGDNKAPKTEHFGSLYDMLREIYHPARRKLVDMNVHFVHSQFKNAGLQAFDVEWSISLVFEEGKYRVSFRNDSSIIERLYHQKLNEEDIKKIKDNYLRSCLDKIEENLNSIRKNQSK